MATHEKTDRLHLHMAIDTTAKLSDMNTKLTDLNAKLSDRVAAIENDKPTPFTFKVNGFEWYLENPLTIFRSPSLYTSLKGYILHEY